VDGVDDSGYVLEDGMLTLPDSPGFGMDLCV
jgi:L-alanine-DL-glutamate epimerase-like enolase superfamily enzyme